MDTLHLLLHPVRLRIVHAMSGGQTRTTSDLCAGLSDVPKPTVYRHVAVLAEAGVLEVESERRVHGAVERTYRLRRGQAVIDPPATASISRDEHRRLFAAAVSALLAEFNAYLDLAQADPYADSVSYRQFPLWLDEGDVAELFGEIERTIRKKLGAEPAPGRRPYLLSTIFFPTGER